MSRKSLIIAAVAGALVAGLVLGRVLFAPRNASQGDHDHGSSADTASSSRSAAQVWTCSMHPQIRQPGPGKCPICGMDLIPVSSGDSGVDAGPRALVMSASALALAEIQTARVERRFPETTVRLVGQLDYDETRLRSLTARFPARIDALFANYTGVAVAKGEHLARIYSPELLTAQRELLSAHAADPNGSLARVARDKLRLWDLLPDQIDAIIARGSVEDEFELRAPTGGVVVAKNIKEGDYVKTGEPLFRIADLSELWLHLQVFESDLAKLRYGQEVAFTVETWPGETFTGRIAFIAPGVDPKTRTIAIRVNVPNTDGRLKPGMFARGQVRVKLAGNNEVFAPDLAGKWISPMHPEIVKDHAGNCDVCGMPLVPAETLGYRELAPTEAPLVVPASALLRTGKRAIVYVKLPNTKAPTFEGREVVLGLEADDGVIVSGLAEGDEVVTHGAFKIDSALQIVAKPSMMSPAGAGPTEGHGTHGHDAKSSESAATTPEIHLEPAMARAILPTYFRLQAALAGDDLAAAKDGLRAMMEVTGHGGSLPGLIHVMLDAKSLDAMREPSFRILSDATITALMKDPAALEGTVIRMHCPMAADNKGADWLQATGDLRNPYFGSAMLTCGEIVEHLK